MKTTGYSEREGGSQEKSAARRSVQGPPGLSHIHPSVPEVWRGCVRDPGRNKGLAAQLDLIECLPVGFVQVKVLRSLRVEP